MADEINKGNKYPENAPDDLDGYILAGDLKVDGWNTAIASSGKPFTYAFFGGNHSLTLTSAKTGLFGETSGSKIEDLVFSTNIRSDNSTVGGLVNHAINTQIVNMTAAVVVQANDNVGGLVGTSENGSISHITLEGSVTAIKGNNAGGIVGYATGTQFVSSDVSDITVTAEGEYAGAIVGVGNRIQLNDCLVQNVCSVSCAGNCGAVAGSVSDSSIIENVYSDCTVSSDSGSVVGGFAGAVSNSTITHCKSAGTVTCAMDYAGGFIGMAEEAVITSSVSLSSVSGSGNSYGGFIGQSIATKATISNCAAFGDVNSSKGSMIGGFIGSGYGQFDTGLVSNRVTGVSNIGGFIGNLTGDSFRVSNFYTFNLLSGESAIYLFTQKGESGTYTNVGYNADGCSRASCSAVEGKVPNGLSEIVFKDSTLSYPVFGVTLSCNVLDKSYNISLPESIMDIVGDICGK